MLVSSTGVTFSGGVEVALSQPSRDPATILRFLLMGFYVGVVPVALGMMWFPLIKTAGAERWFLPVSLGSAFLLADTIGRRWKWRFLRWRASWRRR
jgi:hypothetical protein